MQAETICVNTTPLSFALMKRFSREKLKTVRALKAEDGGEQHNQPKWQAVVLYVLKNSKQHVYINILFMSD